MEQAWPLVAQVLEHEIGSLSSALLCTREGAVLTALSMPDAEKAPAARVTGALVVAADALTSAGPGTQDAVETIQLSSGGSHTVVARVAASGSESLVLSVTAQDVSPGVLLVQTRQAAEALRERISVVG